MYLPLFWERFIYVMRIIAKKTLKSFWLRYPDAEEPLLAWYHEVKHEAWAGPAAVKAKYGNASIVGNNRVVFNIRGNRYRLVVAIHYRSGIVLIRFLGTHAEYDEIDVEEI